MHIRDWAICLVEPNKYEAQIVNDLLWAAGSQRSKVFLDSAEAMQALELWPANVIIAALESQPIDGVEWTRQFRRNKKLANRKAPIFLTSRAFSRATAEECRHAGANALIGKPVSGATLIATITKVLANPRPFIDAEGYVGPCRRAGIVTAGKGSRRRKSDNAGERAAPSQLAAAAASLAQQVSQAFNGKGELDACLPALNQVISIAEKAGDGPMMRACAAFALQLAAKGLKRDAEKAALAVCLAGVTELAALAASETAKRDALAESVRQAVAKAALQKAA